MKQEKTAKRLKRVGLRHNKNEWHVSEISGKFYSMEYYFSTLIELCSKKELTGNDLIQVDQCNKELEKLISEICTKPELEKYAKKYDTFLKSISKEKNDMLKEIEKAHFPGKTIEVAIATTLLEEMKEIEPKLNNDYKYLEDVAKSGIGKIHDAHYESDDYTLLMHLQTATTLNQTISKLSTSPEAEQELKNLQDQSATLYEAISTTVVNDYNSLKQIDAELNEQCPLIRNYIDEELEKL